MSTKPKAKPPSQQERIAERIRKAREALDLTQQQVADKAGISRSAIVHYERGNVIPGGPELIGIAKALRATPNYILSGSEAFFKSPAPEHALVTNDEANLAARVAICMSELDREMAEAVSALAMSLLKATVRPKKYNEVMAAIAVVEKSTADLLQGAERVADQITTDIARQQPKPKRRKTKS